MKRFIAALCLAMPVASFAGEWYINNHNVVVVGAESTNDVLGVDICNRAVIFAAPAVDVSQEGSTEISAVLRIDSVEPWQMKLTVRIKDQMVSSAANLSPQLLEEMLQGSIMRIKWGKDAYSRFDLSGLAEVLKTVQCDDKEFFPESSDSDYFL